MSQPIAPPLKDNVLYIDNSSMELFTTCPRQAYYYIVRRLELNRSRIPLDFGDRFHDVLRFMYTTFSTAYRSAADNDAVVAFAAAKKLDTPEDDHRTVPYLVDGVRTYLQQYPAEPFSIAVMPSGVPAVEVPFMFPLGTIDSPIFGKITVIWTGKIDMVYRSNARLGVMDHKTTSIMGPQFFAEFEIAHQMYGYAAAMQYVFGEPVHEITINGLGCRKPTKTGKVYEFSRHIIPIQQDLMSEWHDDSLAIVSDFIGHCERGYFPRHTKWCVAKYGACQYRAICTLPPAQRETALSTTEYRPVTWNPLEHSQPLPPTSPTPIPVL